MRKIVAAVLLSALTGACSTVEKTSPPETGQHQVHGNNAHLDSHSPTAEAELDVLDELILTVVVEVGLEFLFGDLFHRRHNHQRSRGAYFVRATELPLKQTQRDHK